jgi:CheY-like chemotaxis protein
MSEPQALGGIHVLLVDDDDDTRDIIERVLARRGAEVVAVASAPAGLLRFAERKFDVLLVDIMMPGMDGYEFIGKIRALPPDQGGKVPAATLTARVVTEDRMESVLAGFQGHVKKPVDAEQLAHVVATLAGRGRPGA